jgi:hypothetical protein
MTWPFCTAIVFNSSQTLANLSHVRHQRFRDAARFSLLTLMSSPLCSMPIDSSMVKRLILLAAESGKTRMDLTTAKANKPAQAAYESLGWVRDEIYYAYSKSVDT